MGDGRPLRGHESALEDPGGTLTPWERSVATKAGFTEWELDHCPAALIKDTYAFQATALGMALGSLRDALLDSLVRWLPFRVKW